MENTEIVQVKEESSLTIKPKWEILVSSKLVDYGVKEELHGPIIKHVEGLLPFSLIMTCGILMAIFGNKEK